MTLESKIAFLKFIGDAMRVKPEGFWVYNYLAILLGVEFRKGISPHPWNEEWAGPSDRQILWALNAVRTSALRPEAKQALKAIEERARELEILPVDQ